MSIACYGPTRSIGKRVGLVLLALGLGSMGGQAIAAASAAAAAPTPITVCSKSPDYYDINGDNAISLRAKLSNPANFGPTGKYGDYSWDFLTIGSPLTEANLIASSCDIYFSGYEGDGEYTSAELQQLRNWTAHDHTRQVTAGCDDTDDDPVCAALGFTVTTDTDSYGLLSGSAVNPIDCDDSLTPGDEINMAGGVGGYFTGSALTPTNTLAVHETNGAADPSKPVIVYTGNYFLTADINMIETGGTEETVTDGPDVTSINDKMVMNAFSAMADASDGKQVCSSAGPPTPTPTPTAPHATLKAPHAAVRRSTVSTTCSLGGANVGSCAVTAYARLNGRDIVVGRGTAAATAGHQEPSVPVIVRLNSRGKRLADRPGGVSLQLRATVRRPGSTSSYKASSVARVTAPRVALRRVLFAFDSARVTPRYVTYLKQVRKRMGSVDKIGCTGHTDYAGSNAHEKNLSLRRARAVCSLLAHGRKRTVVHARGFGGIHPVTKRGTAKSRKANRYASVSLSY